MIPSKIKTLIDKYCMGIVPSDVQMDEIMNLAVFLNADASEVSAYIKKMVDGPTKSEREAAAKEAAEKKRQSEELRAKKAKEEAERRAKADAEIKAKKEAKFRAIAESGKLPCIDLGLSVKWAPCNIGAVTPEDSGDYFAWGEVETKIKYDWSNYKHSHTHALLHTRDPKKDYLNQCMDRYCTGIVENWASGVSDNIKELKPKDDVASSKSGGWLISLFLGAHRWRTPTAKEINELEERCKWQWMSVNGKKGFLITGPNGNSIFMPAAGYKDGQELHYENSSLCYWSSSLDEDYSAHALNRSETSRSINGFCGYRCLGLPIRPVKK